MLEKIIDIDKIQAYIEIEGENSDSTHIMQLYKSCKANPTILNLVRLTNEYRLWSACRTKCIVCNEYLPVTCARLLSTAPINNKISLLSAHLQHEGTPILNFILKTVKEANNYAR